MEKSLNFIGNILFSLRFLMSFFYIGLVALLIFILLIFGNEVVHLFSYGFSSDLKKMDLIIKVLELVDITMVAQLVWVVSIAGFSLFVTSEHFDKKEINKPDWLDHVNTYNLKLKLAFAMISISGVHALKTYLEDVSTKQEILMTVSIHLLFVLSAVGIAYSEYLTRKDITKH